MKAQKLRELDSNELVRQETDIHEQLFRLRFQMSMGQTDGLKKYRDAKKDRARMLLILRERNVDVAKAESAVAAQPVGKKGGSKKAAKKDK